MPPSAAFGSAAARLMFILPVLICNAFADLPFPFDERSFEEGLHIILHRLQRFSVEYLLRHEQVTLAIDQRWCFRDIGDQRELNLDDGHFSPFGSGLIFALVRATGLAHATSSSCNCL